MDCCDSENTKVIFLQVRIVWNIFIESYVYFNHRFHKNPNFFFFFFEELDRVGCHEVHFLFEAMIILCKNKHGLESATFSIPAIVQRAWAGESETQV